MELKRESKLLSIKKNMGILYLLNITDLIATLILINTGFVHEANPVMINVVNNSVKVILYKVLLPAILLAIPYININKATDRQLKRMNILLIATLILYGLINLTHIVWFSLYMFLM